MIASICLTSCFCSLLSIGGISFNRYVHICHNNLYGRIYTLRNTVLMCLGVWCVSFMLEMSCFFGWGDHTYDRKTLSCVWDRTSHLSFTIYFSSVGVAFPIILISVCYVKIFLHVRKSKLRVLNALQTSEQSQSVRLARSLFIIFVVFAVCWTPYAFIVVLDYKDTWPREWHIFSILIAHTNSSLNSVLYGVTNNKFREAYKRLLAIVTCRGNRNSVSPGQAAMHAGSKGTACSSTNVERATASDVKHVASEGGKTSLVSPVSPIVVDEPHSQKVNTLSSRGPYIE